MCTQCSLCVCFVPDFDRLWCSLRSSNYKVMKCKQQLLLVDRRKKIKKQERKTVQQPEEGKSLLFQHQWLETNSYNTHTCTIAFYTTCSFETFLFSENRRGQIWYLPKSSPYSNTGRELVRQQQEEKDGIISCKVTSSVSLSFLLIFNADLLTVWLSFWRKKHSAED